MTPPKWVPRTPHPLGGGWGTPSPSPKSLKNPWDPFFLRASVALELRPGKVEELRQLLSPVQRRSLAARRAWAEEASGEALGPGMNNTNATPPKEYSIDQSDMCNQCQNDVFQIIFLQSV